VKDNFLSVDFKPKLTDFCYILHIPKFLVCFKDVKREIAAFSVSINSRLFSHEIKILATTLIIKIRFLKDH